MKRSFFLPFVFIIFLSLVAFPAFATPPCTGAGDAGKSYQSPNPCTTGTCIRYVCNGTSFVPEYIRSPDGTRNIDFGNDTTTCTSDISGRLRYDGTSTWEYCNGTSWTALVSGGGGGGSYTTTATKTSDYTANTDEIVIVEATSSLVEITPPSSPSTGDKFMVAVLNNDYGVTADFTTAKLHTSATIDSIGGDGSHSEYMYVNSTFGWSKTGENAAPLDIDGEAMFTSTGSHSWTVPAYLVGEYIHFVAIGGGGGGYFRGYTGGGGGSLCSGYIEVTQAMVDSSATIVVGAGGAGSTVNGNNGVAGGDSSITLGGTTYCTAGGGEGGIETNNVDGGTTTITSVLGTYSITGYDGGRGGRDQYDNGGGGGAAGYSGNGGYGSYSYGGFDGAGGGGGGGGGNRYTAYSGGGGGGGVYPFGEGSSGEGGSGSDAVAPPAGGGGGGSGGLDGETGGQSTSSSATIDGGDGGLYGGGGGADGGSGAQGVVRILWGQNRAFPSTDVSTQKGFVSTY